MISLAVVFVLGVAVGHFGVSNIVAWFKAEANTVTGKK